MTMTSRERVHKMFRGELKNSFCISSGGMANDNMSCYAYAKLLKYLGMEDKDITVYDLFQFIPRIDIDVINRLGGDFVHVQRPRYRFNLDQKEWKEGTLNDGTPCLYPAEYDPIIEKDGSKWIEMDGMRYARMPKNGLYYDVMCSPLKDAEDPEELRLFHPAAKLSDEDVEYIAEMVDYMYENTDKAIVLLFAGQLIEQAQKDFGFEMFYCNLAIEKELMHAYFRMLTDTHLYNLKKILERCGEKIDVIWFADDIGTQESLQISIPMYKEMIKPYSSQMWSYIHDNFEHIKVLYHCCGAIFDIIPELIDAGVDILNPIQISAKGMDPQRVKDTYGKDLIFWGGGTDAQNLAFVNDIDEIKANARRLAEIFSEGGNYVFSQVHNFQADVPPEKILAVFDAAKELRDELEAQMDE